jgi:hypothetical protein
MLTGTATAIVWRSLDLGDGVARALQLGEGARVGAVVPSIVLATVLLIVVSRLTRERAAVAR